MTILEMLAEKGINHLNSPEICARAAELEKVQDEDTARIHAAHRTEIRLRDRVAELEGIVQTMHRDNSALTARVAELEKVQDEDTARIQAAHRVEIRLRDKIQECEEALRVMLEDTVVAYRVKPVKGECMEDDRGYIAIEGDDGTWD